MTLMTRIGRTGGLTDKIREIRVNKDKQLWG